MKTIKIGLITLGCDKNRTDAEKIISEALNLGKLQLISNYADAEIIILNTCAFIDKAIKESTEAILEASSYKKQNLKLLMVTGCLAERFYNEIDRSLLPEVDYILKLSENEKINDIIVDYINKKELNNSNLISNKKEPCEGSINSNFIENLNFCKIPNQENQVILDNHSFLFAKSDRVLTTPYHYAYLKIADGCNNFCSYCTIPFIRGRYISNTIENLVKEAQALIDNYEIKELILVAQDVTRYGEDLRNNTSLIALLDKLSELKIDKLRLNYCYPERITKELIHYIDKNPKICKYIDIPMQHISNNILKSMNRKSTKESLYNLINDIRKASNYISLRSTFILGFPSETEENFKELLTFLEYANFDNAGFFTYSREKGTKAYKLDNQIPKKIKIERYKLALAKQTEIMLKNLNKKLNTIIEVRCDGIDYEKGLFFGHTEHNAPEIDKKIYFKSKKEIVVGENYKILIKNIKKLDLIGDVYESSK